MSIERRASASIKGSNATPIVVSSAASTLTAKRIPIEVCTRTRRTYSLAPSVKGDLIRLVVIDMLDYIDLAKLSDQGSATSEAKP